MLVLVGIYMGITQELAGFVYDFDPEEVESDVRKKLKLNFLDFLGLAIAGSQEPDTMVLYRVIEAIGGNMESSVVGKRTKTSITNASLINGYSAHIYDFDDLNWRAIVHPAAPVFAATLATAEFAKSTGNNFIGASILGYEVSCRIGYAVSPEHHHGFHSTGTCGVFGAAVGAGKLLGLDEKQTTYALGIAGTQSAGLQEVLGTMCKPLHPGKAAMDGVISSLLAKEGLNSTTKIIEGDKGFCKVMSPKGYDESRVTDGIGEGFEVMNTVIKKYSSCGETHSAIDATLSILKKNKIKADYITAIEVHVTPTMHDVARFDTPTSGLQGRFSFPFCVALSIVDGKVSDKMQFTDDRVRDPRFVHFMQLIDVVEDVEESAEDFTQAFRSAKVVLRTKTDRYEMSVYPELEPTESEVRQKFTSLAEKGNFTSEQVGEIIEVVDKLENLESMNDLMNILNSRVI